MRIIGVEGLSDSDIQHELERGARFVVYGYVVSFLVLTIRRSTDVHFLKAGQSGVGKGLPWTLLTLFFGWWGFPFGIIYTPLVLLQNLRGGKNVTHELLGAVNRPPPFPTR